MRSKSETIIGNRFERIALPYRYDDLVNILRNSAANEVTPNEPRPFRNSYFSDFKVPNLLGGITVHEHFGSFQLEQYSGDALKRMNDYHNFPVVEIPGRPVKSSEFTWSFESDLQDKDALDRLIARLLMPGFF